MLTEGHCTVQRVCERRQYVSFPIITYIPPSNQLFPLKLQAEHTYRKASSVHQHNYYSISNYLNHTWLLGYLIHCSVLAQYF